MRATKQEQRTRANTLGNYISLDVLIQTGNQKAARAWLTGQPPYDTDDDLPERPALPPGVAGQH